MEPNEESQEFIAEALGLPVELVRSTDWSNWVPLTTDRVVPLALRISVPVLREALRPVERRTFLSISGAALSTLAAS
ncbi:hypothetical protein ABZ890_41965 [Streptomyces sp. NPDC046984]|uniref:hypothetical protein n=1 Tax=Streptomyces sp. NPDC046984 TaxID=3155138 RepID=UPI0033E188BC